MATSCKFTPIESAVAQFPASLVAVAHVEITQDRMPTIAKRGYQIDLKMFTCIQM